MVSTSTRRYFTDTVSLILRCPFLSGCLEGSLLGYWRSGSLGVSLRFTRCVLAAAAVDE